MILPCIVVLCVIKFIKIVLSNNIVIIESEGTIFVKKSLWFS